MKKKIIYSALFFLLSLTVFSQTQKEIGEEFIKTLLIEKNYAKAYDYFDNSVKEKITLFAFEQAQTSIEEKYGKFIEILETNNEDNVYYFYSKFEETNSDIKVRFNQESKITGFIFATHKEFDKKKVIPKY
jgi:hypothetical protein